MTARPEVLAPASIVDVLIAERAPSLTGHPLAAAAVRRVLYPLLRYPEAVRFARLVEPLDGPAVLDLAADVLDLDLRFAGLERVPASGRAILIANHPTGIADGIALWSALRHRRPDLTFLANADALRVAPGLRGQVIPVDWVPERRTHAGSRETFRRSARALAEERLIATFPAGRLARLTWRGLEDRPWLPSVLTLARKFDAPLLPVRIRARNSALFYAFSQISQELRDITLFNELLNKRGGRFELSVGTPVDPDDLPDQPAAALATLRRMVEGAPAPDAAVRPGRGRRRLAGAPA